MAGRKAHEPTEKTLKQVETLAGYGLPMEQIGHVIGVSVSTLQKYYREPLDKGVAKANALIAEGLFKQATGGNTTALIFWCKTRMGWREVQRHEVGVGEGEVPTTGVKVTFEVPPGDGNNG